VRGPTGFALAAAALLIVAGLVFLDREGPAVAGSTGVRPRVFVMSLRSHESVCLPDQVVPAGTERVQLFVGTGQRPLGTLSIEGTTDDGTVLKGTNTFIQGGIALAFAPAAAAARTVTLCLRNRSAGPLAIAGEPLGDVVTSGGRRFHGTPSLIFPATDGHSWLDEAGAITRRFDHVRWAPFGQGTAWVAVALALAAVAAGVSLTLRGARGNRSAA
jgi:hypothetical protein